MADRRIDAIGKSDATAWNSTQLPKGSPNQVRILSGSLAQTTPGTVIHAMVQKDNNGAYKVVLNGEAFLIKGVPDSLAGKNVAFIVQKPMNQANGKAELFWIGATQSDTEGKQTQGSTQANLQTSNSKQNHLQSSKSKQDHLQTSHSKQVHVISTLPGGIKEGQIISGRIETVHGKQMSINMMVPDTKDPMKSNPHMILTTSMHGLKEGQQVSVKVIPDINYKPALEITPQQPMNQAGIKTSQAATQMAHFKLAAGDTTPAFVQQRLSNGHVQLNIQGTSVETPAPNHVQKGDVLILKMNKPPSDFQLLSVQKNIAGKALSTLKANLSDSNTPMAQNITTIRNVVANAPISDITPINALSLLESSLKANEVSSTQPLDGGRLKQIIHHAGTGLEAKLLQTPSLNPAIQQDLKLIMLQLANHQTGTAQQTELIKTLTELAQQSVSRIETSQALNLLAHLQGEPIRVELPMLVNQQIINVQLSMQQQTTYDHDNSQEEHNSDESYNILFSLELSQLGNIRVDANISDTTVHARIYNDNKDSNLFILDNIQRLEARLLQLGFKEIYLLASQQQLTTEKQQQFDQMEQMLPASLHLLDIRI